MSRIAALGSGLVLEGLVLGGVEVHLATDAAELEREWEQLPADLGLLMLTPSAQVVLAERLPERPRLLVAVLP